MKGAIHKKFTGGSRSIALALLLAPMMATALTVSLTTDADTFLSENYPSNNFGSLLYFNSGTTQNNYKNRGLMRFDLLSAIPPGSKIKSANLVLECVGAPPPAENPPPARFNLHRLLKSWGEGNKLSPTNCTSCSGQGATATTNEATWYFRYAFTTNLWAQPGASAGTDYVATASSGVTVYTTAESPYAIPNSAALVSDLQLWLDQPQTNFGWALVCQQETTIFTARRFGSHEDENNAPRLDITFLVQPRIDRIQKIGNQFNLSFIAMPDQNYAVEFRGELNSGAWQTLATIPASPITNNVLLVDTPLTPQRFYRLVSY